MKAIVNSTQRDSNKGGFTLLEVLIAMVIISVGALGLAMMQGSTAQANSFGNQLTQATTLGQSLIEKLSTTQLDQLTGSGTESDLNEDGAPGGPFNRTWVVADNTDFSKRITVTVSWNNDLVSDADETHSVQLSTITRGAHN